MENIPEELLLLHMGLHEFQDNGDYYLRALCWNIPFSKALSEFFLEVLVDQKLAMA